MKEKKSVAEAITETVACALGGNDFVLPPTVVKTGCPYSDEINAAYEAEIESYRVAPPPPCDKATALKHLKRFARTDFPVFWTAPVHGYLPAVSEGTMKLCECVYPHDQAIRHAKELISTLSERELAGDFLYGVAHNAPEYRTALACYYYIRNLPTHEFRKKYVGSTAGKEGTFEERYNENRCEICGYDSALSTEPKMQFWHINQEMANFCFDGRMGRSSLNTAILFLEEYKKLRHPKHSAADYEHFSKIIDVIEKAPQNTTSKKLLRTLEQSGQLKMTPEQTEAFVDTLGYLDILHPDDSHGMIYGHTCEREMLPPLSDRGYAGHPVNRWTRRCGIDYESIRTLFDGIYD